MKAIILFVNDDFDIATKYIHFDTIEEKTIELNNRMSVKKWNFNTYNGYIVASFNKDNIIKIEMYKE